MGCPQPAKAPPLAVAPAVARNSRRKPRVTAQQERPKADVASYSAPLESINDSCMTMLASFEIIVEPHISAATRGSMVGCLAMHCQLVDFAWRAQQSQPFRLLFYNVLFSVLGTLNRNLALIYDGKHPVPAANC
jgi:hypothetical protein